MVPRVIFGEGVPTHSICPFCGAPYQDVTPENPNAIFKALMRRIGGLLNSEQTTSCRIIRLLTVVLVFVLPFSSLAGAGYL